MVERDVPRATEVAAVGSGDQRGAVGGAAAGSASAAPVPVLIRGPKSLEDTWPRTHFWLAAPVHAAAVALAPAPGPVTSRHLPPVRSVPSL